MDPMDIVYPALNVALLGVGVAALGVVALVRARRAPRGRGLIRAAGSLLVALGVIAIANTVWWNGFVYPIWDDDRYLRTDTPAATAWVVPLRDTANVVLWAGAILLLLLAAIRVGRDARSTVPMGPPPSGPAGVPAQPPAQPSPFTPQQWPPPPGQPGPGAPPTGGGV